MAKPLDLAEYLLRDDPAWPAENLLAAIETGREQTLKQLAPLPVHLLYWAARVSGDGTVQFRSDIYQRDDRLAAAFTEDPSGKPNGGH